MKHTNFLVSWAIIAVTLPVLATLAWNQFNWLQELRSREDHRIEYSMVGSAQALSKSLKEELFFLPSLLRIRQEDSSELTAILTERYVFWRYYALFPDMIKNVYILKKDTRSMSELKPDGLSPGEPIPAGLPVADRSFVDTDNELQLVMPVFGPKENRSLVLCVIDKEVLFHAVIPAIAAKSLESTDVYAYRIVDARSGALVYLSNPHLPAALFDEPDIELPVFEPLHIPAFQQPPDFLTRNLPENYSENFPFIKERIKVDQHVDFDNDRDNLPPQLFSYLILQIVNRDGSLAALSRKATIQNALISFGTVLLLALVMIVLAEATRRSRALALSQQEFIATITHELKTPLAVISSAAQNLTDGLIRDQKKAEQYGALIKKESSRLGVSIEHFLLYSNTNSINRLRPILCDISELIDAALKFTDEERQKMEFRTEVLLPDEPVFIRGDKIALESVFQNLAQNVIRHADSGKYLGFIVSLIAGSKRDPRTRVMIKVRDKGPGISAREQKLIFEPFARGKRAIEGQVPGNGIGLNLVRRIVQVHEGTITVESKGDNGCTFTIILPVSKGDDDARQNTDDRR